MIKSKMSKDWDPNLTPEQNYVLKQEGTERPGSSPLNQEKREGSYHCVGCGESYLNHRLNMKVDLAGLHFTNLYLEFSRKNGYAYWLSKD